MRVTPTGVPSSDPSMYLVRSRPGWIGFMRMHSCHAVIPTDIRHEDAIVRADAYADSNTEFGDQTKVRPSTSSWYYFYVEATKGILILPDLPALQPNTHVRIVEGGKIHTTCRIRRTEQYHIKMASNRSVRFEPISCEISSRLHKKNADFHYLTS
jgi:hypothetical protein